ncbi:MAG: hypothetical protein J0L80_12680 [Chitinophagales bacterium]|nr:hypothetical protein [Chitinophagales bacterium]
MKRLLLIGLILAGVTTLTSCVKNEYYNTTPNTTPVGYQNIFDDNFDYDSHNWSFTDAYNNASVRITGGQLKYVYNPSNDGTNTVAVNTGLNTNYNFLIQTRMQSNNAMGLVWGVSNNDYGYSLFIDDQGYFAVYKEGNANTAVKTLIDWQYNSAIVAGWNNIEVEQQGDYWIGYANGKKLFEIGAQNLYGSKVGYIVMAGTTGYADYLTVQW